MRDQKDGLRGVRLSLVKVFVQDISLAQRTFLSIKSRPRDICGFAQELSSLFSSQVTSGQKLIFSCDSGVTACILALAAEIGGYKTITIYNCLWCEWGTPSHRLVETGKAGQEI